MRARDGTFLAASLVLAWVGLAVPAQAALDVDFGRYHALVIGINAYKNLPKLETAVNDATAVAEVLRQKYAFEVTLLLNPGRSEVIRALDSFSTMSKGTSSASDATMASSTRPNCASVQRWQLRGEPTERDNLLIYYAGHGVLDIEADVGFWMSVDAEEETRADWISIGAITSTVKAMSAKHVMIVSDSCYSGRLTRGLSVSVKTGSERVAEQTSNGWRRNALAPRSSLIIGLEPV